MKDLFPIMNENINTFRECVNNTPGVDITQEKDNNGYCTYIEVEFFSPFNLFLLGQSYEKEQLKKQVI